MSILCFLSLDVFIYPTDMTSSTHGLVRRVKTPRNPWVYLEGHLRNSMWRVGSEASKIGQVGIEQATTVVWGSVLLRSPRGQDGVL